MHKKLQKGMSEFIYFFLIFFFCYTAFNKLINLEAFRSNLMKTSLFNEFYANIFSIIIICLEIVIVLLLFFYKKIGLFFLIVIMITFTLYISFLNYNGYYEVCGCGGVLNGLSYKYHLIINIGLTIGAIYSFITFKNLENEN